MESGMPIVVYLHRTKKKDFAVAETVTVWIDFDKIPAEKRDDVDFLNRAFSNDAQRLARQTETVKRYGTAYLSFIRPQYEGPEDKNGTDKVYFDNREMLFKRREEANEEK